MSDKGEFLPLVLHFGPCSCPNDESHRDCPLDGWMDMGVVDDFGTRRYKHSDTKAILYLRPDGREVSAS